MNLALKKSQYTVHISLQVLFAENKNIMATQLAANRNSSNKCIMQIPIAFLMAVITITTDDYCH